MRTKKQLSSEISAMIEHKDLARLVDTYVAACRNKDKALSKQSLEGLRAMEAEAVQSFIALSKSGDFYKREAVMRALGVIGDSSFTQTIVNCLQDSNSYVREAAVQAIGAIEDSIASDDEMFDEKSN